MKTNVLWLYIILTLIGLSQQSAVGKRTEINSLTDCIAEADIIVMGVVESRADVGDTGVLKIKVLGSALKGQIEGNTFNLTDAFFQSDHVRTLEGEIIPQTGQSYIFFLKAGAESEYRLFNSYDGVIPSCVPVAREIENQLRKKE